MPEGRDFTFRADMELPETPIARWDANTRAIRVLKDLEISGRQATDAEKEALAAYSGFGDAAFTQAFDRFGAREPAWKQRREELEALLTPEELAGMGFSRVNAFYTTPEIVDRMWETMEAMGARNLKAPRILEPSAGSGRFLAQTPRNIADNAKRVAVEKDPVTADILKHLFPETTVYKGGFEEAPLADDSFDIAISNVPFGKVRVYDKDYNASGRKHLTNSIHNYFFAKGLDKVKPGGVVAFITSHHTLDAPTAEPVRRYLADRADLIGALRLPQGAFPDTQVVTDIIYLRKRPPGAEPGDDSWVESENQKVRDKYGRSVDVDINKYFLENPSLVLGSHSAEGSMYGSSEYTVLPDKDRPAAQALAQESKRIAAQTGGRAFSGTTQAEAAAPAQEGTTARPKAAPRPGKAARYVERDGILYIAADGQEVKASLPEKAADRVVDLLRLKKQARSLVGKEGSASSTDAEMEADREALREMYEAYTAKHEEAINTPPNKQFLSGDPDAHLLFALESYDKESECWQPADIMYQRIVGAAQEVKANTPADALAVTQDEAGALNFERMGALTGRSGEDVRADLEAERLIFKEPDGRGWVTADDYLSGDVRSKLQEAEIKAAADPSYRVNVETLQGIQPPWISAEDIGAEMGAPWIPADMVNAWVREHLNPTTSYSRRRSASGDYFIYTDGGEAYLSETTDEDGKVKTTLKGASGVGGWNQVEDLRGPDAVMKAQWGTPERPAPALILAALRNSPIDVTTGGNPNPEATEAARQKMAEIKQSFADWVWTDPERRERLERKYNELYNADVLRSYDGSHLAFPGMSLEWQRQMRPFQRDAIQRIVTDGTTLLAHEVGFGKSATMIASAMERKRLGLSQKPVFVVPKTTREQFAGQFMEIYPGARLLTPSGEDFTSANRPDFINRAATGDWDAVILSSEQFQAIPVKPETEARWIRRQMEELKASLSEVNSDTNKGQQTQKDIETAVNNLGVDLRRLQAEMGARRDDTLYFEDMGFDQVYVDEADRYKNLAFASQLASGRTSIKGLTQSKSKRAWDMFMKIRYLQEQSGEKASGFSDNGVVFATGTPVANTIAETWTMMRYLQPQELRRQGVARFDDWAATFGVVEQGYEQSVSGQYKPVQRFASFKNGKALKNLFQNVADIRVASETPEMLERQPRLLNSQGEGKRETVVAPNHDYLQGYMQAVIERIEALKDPHHDPHEDNMLKISSDARKASLDVRMVDPSAPHNPSGKIPLAARKVAEIHGEEEENKGTQLVFLDFGTPKEQRAGDDSDDGDDGELTGEEATLLRDVYRSLRNEMVANGVPEDEIAFIHDYKTDEARQALFEAVRQGDVRVLVGSTEKIGVGVNVQDRGVAAHHIDVPWRPRDVEQREGRIIRQGNKIYGPVLDEDTKEVVGPGRGVKIYNYIQEGSFDGFMWNAVEKKARGIKYLMRRHGAEDNYEDVDPFVIGAAEAKALASGNPLAIRAVELDQEVQTGRVARRAHQRQVSDARIQKGELEYKIGAYERVLPELEADAAYVEGLPADQAFAVTITGKTFDKRPEAGKALAEALEKVPYNNDAKARTLLGSYKGFDVYGRRMDSGYSLVIERETGQDYRSDIEGGVTESGLIARLENLVKGIQGRADRMGGNLDQARAGIALYEEQMRKPFAQEKALATAERELRSIQAKLRGEPGDVEPVEAMAAEQAEEDGQVPAEVVQAVADRYREPSYAEPNGEGWGYKDATARVEAFVSRVPEVVEAPEEPQRAYGGVTEEEVEEIPVSPPEPPAPAPVAEDNRPYLVSIKTPYGRTGLQQKQLRGLLDDMTQKAKDLGGRFDPQLNEWIMSPQAADALKAAFQKQVDGREAFIEVERVEDRAVASVVPEAAPAPAAAPMASGGILESIAQFGERARQEREDAMRRREEQAHTPEPEPAPTGPAEELLAKASEEPVALTGPGSVADLVKAEQEPIEMQAEPIGSRGNTLEDLRAREDISAMETAAEPPPSVSFPDADFITLAEAVEAEEPIEAADAPGEVGDVLEAQGDVGEAAPVAMPEKPTRRKRSPKAKRSDEPLLYKGTMTSIEKERKALDTTLKRVAEQGIEGDTRAKAEVERARERVKDQEDVDVLYQGHIGPGIGELKTENPSRRDGDNDTVVAERRPRKADVYEPSPLPLPESAKARKERWERTKAFMLEKDAGKQKERKRKRSGGGRKPRDKAQTSPGGVPRVVVVRG